MREGEVEWSHETAVRDDTETLGLFEVDPQDLFPRVVCRVCWFEGTSRRIEPNRWDNLILPSLSSSFVLLS